MHQPIQWSLNTLPAGGSRYAQLMSRENVDKAWAFHRTFPQYAPTPLANLEHMAQALGLGGLYLKDESHRFGLNAFKVLGGSFAMARYIAGALDTDVSRLSFDYLTSQDFRRKFGQAVFFTATDGNHGRGVAWAARQLGQRAVVCMPQGSARSRFDNIAREGAEVTIEPLNYDDCVRLAAARATQVEHGVVIQDTAWEGYEDIPAWIMQGYGTMAGEAARQLEEQGAGCPTHILIQAGVGSLAGAVAGYFACRFPAAPPKVIVVEAGAADCFYRSALAGDGAPRAVDGDLRTIMAGLACGEVNPIAWDILRTRACAFLSCPDWVSARGMRMLAAPLRGDPAVISGESGAVGMGALAAIMAGEPYAELRRALGLDSSSRVLLFSTEGDTDPDNYRRIVWDGV